MPIGRLLVAVSTRDLHAVLQEGGALADEVLGQLDLLVALLSMKTRLSPCS